MMSVGEKIKKYIESKGITQMHISHQTNISAAKLSLSLSGKRRMTFEEYELICGVLEVGTDKFLEPKQLQSK